MHNCFLLLPSSTLSLASICACQQGWEGWIDCSVESDIDPFAVQCHDNPVITVGTQIPYWLFGTVQITAKPGATAEVRDRCGCWCGALSPRSSAVVTIACEVGQNVQIRANIVTCRGDPVPTARVTDESCVTRLVDGNSVFSDPAFNIGAVCGCWLAWLVRVPRGANIGVWVVSVCAVDNTGTAFFASTSYYAASMPTGCYAFVYSFYSTSTKNMCVWHRSTQHAVPVRMPT